MVETVKSLELVAVPAVVVTEIFPVVAPDGTSAINCVVVPELNEAVVPLNLTVLLLSDELKLVPIIVTLSPTLPLDGVNEVIVGAVLGGVTVARVNET